MSDPGESGGSPADDQLRRHSTAVAAGILLSRVAGLAREIAMARLLGTGGGAEAFKAALRVPNLLQNLLGEGVLSASFVPVYARLLDRGREEDAGRLAGAIAGLLICVVTVVVALTMVFAEPITRVLAWGFVPGTERYELTVQLVRIVAPGVGLLVLSAWCLAILNAHRRFFVSYVAPVVWNAAIIGALAFVALRTRSEVALATAMAWGALVGSGLQLVVQLPRVLTLTRGLSLSVSLRTTGVRTVVGRFGQVLAGRGGMQIAGYVDLLAASLLAFGAVAALGYAQVLYLLPIALFGMSVAAAELPTLSTMGHAEAGRVTARLDAGLGRVAFFVLPTAIVFALAGEQVVGTVLGGGRFTDEAAVQVGAVLAAYALGLPGATASRLLQSVLYGAGDARSPAVYGLVRVAVAAAVGVTLMFPMDAVGVTSEGVRLVSEPAFGPADQAARIGPENLLRLGAVGLALGAAVGAWLELSLLRRRVFTTFGRVRMFGLHGRALAASSVATAGATVAGRILASSLELGTRASGVLVVLLAGTAHLAVTRLLTVPEAGELLRLRMPRRPGPT